MIVKGQKIKKHSEHGGILKLIINIIRQMLYDLFSKIYVP